MSLHAHVRRSVFERDDCRCRYCGVRYRDELTGEVIVSYYDDAPGWCGGPRWKGLMHVDHVVPRSKGGTDDLENLVTACSKCNLSKYDRTPQEWRSSV